MVNSGSVTIRPLLLLLVVVVVVVLLLLLLLLPLMMWPRVCLHEQLLNQLLRAA